jgi:vacuolar-type H+-ATPase subunit H
MIAFDEIQKATSDLAALGRQQKPPSREEVLEALEKLREKFGTFIAEVSQLYDSAVLVTSHSRSAAIAAQVWKDLHSDFSFVLQMLERLPKFEHMIKDSRNVMRDIVEKAHGLDHLIEDSRNVMRSIVEKADQEYRSYSETAHLLGSKANAEQLREAIEEAKSENLPVYDSADDFLKSLHEK